MAILTGKEIERLAKTGDITIYPFNKAQLNPNSYNLRLSDELLVYEPGILDMAKDNPVRRITIPPEGRVLWPGELYLGKTMEYTETSKFVPMIEGRSSIGRLGMFIHVTAGFGDIGFAGNWTLEIMVQKPLFVYPGVEICQIFYHTPHGSTEMRYTNGKYSGATEVQSSMLWKDFKKE